MNSFRFHVLLCVLILWIGGSHAESAELDDLLSSEQTETERNPPVGSIPIPRNADIQQQIQKLREAFDSRQQALSVSEQRLAFAESLRDRLDNEYESFELRLERAGLNLTDDYANLLRQRLERLRNQTVATGLTNEISDQLSSAREEQLRLEEFEAVIETDDDTRGRLEVKRAQLIRHLHEAVTKHIEVLNEYYNIVTQLRDRLDAYQTLLQQRLFWLPSTNRVNVETVRHIYRGVTWFVSGFKWSALKEAVQVSFRENWPLVVLVSAILLLMTVRRRRVHKALIETGHHVGNVRRDRWKFTFSALVHSFLLALPGVLILSLGYLLLKGGNSFLHALSQGFSNAAVVSLLLRSIYTVTYKKGLGECHFQWDPGTLQMLRKQIPILLAVLIPIIIVMPTMATKNGEVYSDSLGRFLFLIASFALAHFAQRFMISLRMHQSRSRPLQILHWTAVGMPLILAFISLWGYHYTAVRLEGLIFISLCWLAFVILLHYLGLRSLAVRERRMTLKRALETRGAERKLAETREAAESSGEGVPMSFDIPQRDMNEISQQSETLLKIISLTLAAIGLWMLWRNILPALSIFDDFTLWSISPVIEGQSPVPIKLGDLMVALAIGTGTVLAARNLPGTLEIVFLSRLNLEPGVGYAVTTLATYIIVFIGIAAALGGLGFQWSKLQWLVAALGVGLGFGLQEIVANFVSGIILLFERPIRVGDTVTIGGVTGTVSRIRIRATTLVDWDRKEQIIPNKTFVTQDLTNWTLSDPITRVIVRVGVAYGSDIDVVQDLLYQIAVNNERVVEEPAPAVFCVELGESQIDFEVRVFVRDLLDFMPLYHELHSSITRALKEAGIEIPFPQRDIRFRSEPTGRNPDSNE